MLRLGLCLSLALLAPLARADQLRVAVASNFLPMARILEAEFEHETGHQLDLSAGATGALFSQIRHGAPFHLFLAADAERPQALYDLGLTDGPPFTYATGRLVLWRPSDPAPSEASLPEVSRLAIASPQLAPYGRAAEETLRALGQWERLAPRLVTGQTAAQATAMVATGNAEAGLVAAALLPEGAVVWPVPPELYSPILQQAVLLPGAPAAAQEFIALMQHPATLRRLEEAGYHGP